MSYTVLDICTDAARIVNIIDETQQLSPEQGAQALVALNDLMSDMDEDGIELGWFPQTDLANTAPIDNSDARPIKLVFARELAMRAGLTPTLPQDLVEAMDMAYDRLSKRTIEYFEADMTGLPIPQGSYWGGGRGV
jgi:hypothetical protein